VAVHRELDAVGETAPQIVRTPRSVGPPV
jgi:hypothetical protein